MTLDGIKALLRSRKVLLALLGVAQTVILAYFNVRPEVWAAIDALLLVLINAIATEDAAGKQAAQVTFTAPAAPPPDAPKA